MYSNNQRDPVAYCGVPIVNYTWINDYIHYKVWGKTTYPFPNFNGANHHLNKYWFIANLVPIKNLMKFDTKHMFSDW